MNAKTGSEENPIDVQLPKVETLSAPSKTNRKRESIVEPPEPPPSPQNAGIGRRRRDSTEPPEPPPSPQNAGIGRRRRDSTEPPEPPPSPQNAGIGRRRRDSTEPPEPPLSPQNAGIGRRRRDSTEPPEPPLSPQNAGIGRRRRDSTEPPEHPPSSAPSMNADNGNTPPRYTANSKRGGNRQFRRRGSSGSSSSGSSSGNYQGNRRSSAERNSQPHQELVIDSSLPEISITEFRSKPIAELQDMVTEMEVTSLGRWRKQDIVFALLKEFANRKHALRGDGVLEIVRDNPSYGFLRSADNSYLSSGDDIYVSPNQINRNNLRTGDTINCTVRPPRTDERYFALHQVQEVNFDSYDVFSKKKRTAFENLTALFPDERLVLELGNGSSADLSGRVIDLMAPIGKGQRGLIVSPPKAGKTMILQNIAQAIIRNNPECCVFILLIDERPEEVTDMRRSVLAAEVVASTFDEPPTRHVQVADLVIHKAKRLTESGKDVVILLDSITRLARAYNTTTPSSGRILSGGVEANALERPKRFFGAARNIEEGGSLTIIATALIDTGSKMDEVIYEEFKGTGNMELHLDRRISEKRIYPAINIRRSGTRREELLVDEAELQNMYVIRRVLNDKDDVEGINILLERLKRTKTNEEFFASIKRIE